MLISSPLPQSPIMMKRPELWRPRNSEKTLEPQTPLSSMQRKTLTPTTPLHSSLTFWRKTNMVFATTTEKTRLSPRRNFLRGRFFRRQETAEEEEEEEESLGWDWRRQKRHRGHSGSTCRLLSRVGRPSWRLFSRNNSRPGKAAGGRDLGALSTGELRFTGEPGGGNRIYG